MELLKDIADSHEGVSYADLFQLASATAIEVRLLAHGCLAVLDALRLADQPHRLSLLCR